MKKAGIVVVLALLMCFFMTGCGGELNKMYQDVGVQYIENIGTMTFDEAKQIAQNSGYPSTVGNDEITLYYDGEITLNFIEYPDVRLLSSFSFFDSNAYKSIHVSSSFLETNDYSSGKIVSRKVNSLADCESFLFGATSGVDITASSLSENTHAVLSPDSGSSSPEEQYNYDSLQELFTGITKDTTANDLENLINDKSLYFTSQEYNKSGGGRSIQYVIAFTKGAAAQKYADSGDRLKVSFDKENGAIMDAQYTNVSCSKSALFYNYGYWYDFSEKEPGQYSGYYVVDPFGKKTGITIKYSNGREKQTNYYQCKSAESAIGSVLLEI